MRKKKESSARMSTKFLKCLIVELAARLPELSTTKLGRKFADLLRNRPKSSATSLDSCTLLLREMKVTDCSYRVAALSPRRAADLAGGPDLGFWAWEEDLGEEDFAAGADLREELEKVSRKFLSELEKKGDRRGTRRT